MHLTAIIVTLYNVKFSLFKENEISYKLLKRRITPILPLFKKHNFVIILENKYKNMCNLRDKKLLES